MLTNFEIFNNQAYTTATQIIQQEVDKFNAASNGTMILVPKANVGDFDIKSSFGQLANLIRERNPYGSGAVTEEQLAHLIEASVKCARGTPPVRMDQQMFTYIQQNPKLGGVIYGKQLSVAMMQDMINTAILAATSAITNVATKVGTAGYTGISPVTSLLGDTKKSVSPTALNNAVRPFGDKAGNIAAWIMHSTSAFDYWGDNLANAENLYKIGDINVMRDPFGRVFVVLDSPSLIEADGANPNTINILGLVSGAVRIEDNGDFYQNLSETNGDENIKRTVQSEWTFNVGVKNTEWDRTNGGKVPNAAALGTATNWDSNANDTKVTPGVILKTKAAVAA